jgi:hypothetical protein
MSNKIKKMFLLFVIISLSGCAGLGMDEKGYVYNADVAACELQAGGYGTAQGAGGIGTFSAKVAACLAAKGYTRPQ